MIAASAATSVLPLPTSPCSSRFIGLAAAMSAAISASTRFCAFVGLNGSIVLIFSRTLSFNSNCIPSIGRALARFNASPVSSQKNSSKIMRKCACRAERVQQPDIFVLEKESGPCEQLSSVRQLQPLLECAREVDPASGGKLSRTRRNKRPKNAGRDLRCGFVDRDDASGVQSCFAFLVVGGEDLEFGMHHLKCPL